MVLCGGKSRRMGFDKALVKVYDSYGLLKITERLQQLFAEVWLLTDTKQKFPAAFSHLKIVDDLYPNQGPLGGLVTALTEVNTSSIFLMACDMPQFTMEMIQQLARYRHENQVVLFKQQGRLEPLFAFYQITCQAAFKAQLFHSDWRLRSVFPQLSIREIAFSHNRQLANVNYQKELALWYSACREGEDHFGFL
ncbi:molybdenum cofactor guanylyltransferase [Enterococcus faecalis]